MSERNERRRERESRRQRERSREQRRARRESRKSSTTQETLTSGAGANPTQQSGVPAGQQGSTIQQPATETMAGQQLPSQQGQQSQQLQQPSEQQGIAQQPATQQFQPQQGMGQQPVAQQPTFRQPSNYTPQAPLAVGVPTGRAQGAAQQGQFGAAGAPTQSVGGTPAAGGQLASQPSEIYPEAFADHLTEEARDCLDDCIDVSQVAAWCSDRCLEQGPGMAECSRLCNEAATLGAVTAEFIAKDSVNLPAIVDTYVDVAERATDELGKFDAPHTNEAEMVIERSIDSSLDVLESV